MLDEANVRNDYPVERQTETTVKYSVCNFNALCSAENRCHRGVGYKNSVSRFHMYKLSKIYEQIYIPLWEETYRTQKGDKFDIYEPKHRTVTSTKYKDRIPQASFVLNYMYPHMVHKLVESNCACLKGRGVDKAREIFRGILENSKMDDYCIKADISNYFGSINHEALFNALDIDDEWAKRFHMDVVMSNEEEVGITLGSEINQLSAVAFLNELDSELDDGSGERYMDDFVYVGSKEKCETVLRKIEEQCEKNGLKLAKHKTYIQPVKNPIKFLGFTFLRHESGRVTMKRCKDKLNNEKRKLRRMKKSKIPFQKIKEHYTCVRATMKKGSRSGVVKLDRYFNELFKEELENEATNC